MPRHTDHLERLCNKLEHRFGSTDVLYVQAKAELEMHKAYGKIEPLRHDWSKPYDSFIKAWTTNNSSNSRH